jgi:hypothetical protein
MDFMLEMVKPQAELIEDLLGRVDGIFSDLPDESLDWVPDPAMNSMTVLIVHTCGALRYWVGELLGDEPAHRDRSAEFLARGLSKAELHQTLKTTAAQTQRVLEGLRKRDLKAKQYSTIHKDYFSGAFALAHALGHTALHVGHMEIMRELWEQFDWDKNTSAIGK